MRDREKIAVNEDVVAHIRRDCEAELPGIGSTPRQRTLRIKPGHMGHKPGLDYDNIEWLLTYGEGEEHR